MFPRLIVSLALLGCATLALPTGRNEPLPDEVDSDETRRVLGSSVVTSVSVIMDLGHGGAALLSESPGQHADADNAAGGSQQSETFANSPLSTQKRPVGSPPALMSPDRYEFYTFDESGELVRRLMTLEQIQSLIAGGDDANRLAALTADLDANTQPSPSAGDPQEEVVANVQQVLAEELLASIQKNGTEPQEGEVEVEAVVQEVPPPPSSSPKPEQDIPESLPEDDSHEDSDEASLETDDTSPSILSSGEDTGSPISGEEGARPSSQEDSSEGGESEEDSVSGVSDDSGASHDITETSPDEHNDHQPPSIPDSSTEIPLVQEDKEKHTTPSEYVSEKYGIYHISMTTHTPAVIVDVEDSTSGNMGEKTTVRPQTVISMEGDEMTPTKQPELPPKNETQVKDQVISDEIMEHGEVSEEDMEETTSSHGHTNPPSDSTHDAELTNKNPPEIRPDTHHDESVMISDPTPEVEPTPTKLRPDQGDDSSGTDQDGNFSVTTQISEETSHNTQAIDHHLDEIPNLSQTTEFQPPEEADLSQYFAEDNKNSSNASDEKEEDPMNMPGLLGLFSDKLSTLMGISDSLNAEGSPAITTTEPENPAYQVGMEEDNQSEIPEPSASLLPPLVEDEENSTKVNAGFEQYETTEVTNIKDKDTRPSQEDEEDDSDLLDELAESVSGILSQVSDLVDDSEESTSRKPINSAKPTTLYPAQGITSVEDVERNTTPGPMSSIEVLSPETSTFAAVTVQDDMVLLSEGTFMTDEMNDNAPKKPNGDHIASSISGSPTESFTQGSPVTYDMTSTDSTTVPSLKDGAADKPVTESQEHHTEISQPIKENDSVENGSDYTTTTVASHGEVMTSIMDIPGDSSESMAENAYGGEETNGGDADQEGNEPSIEITDNSGADERFETSTLMNSDGVGSEVTATTRRSELEKGSYANDGADKGTTINYASDPVTTETINLEVSSEETPEIVSDGSSSVKESVTHKITEIVPEHAVVENLQQATKPAANKTVEEYLLDEMHKVAEEQSDPLLSPYTEDEQTEELPTALKDKHDKPTSVMDSEDNDDENEAAEGSTMATMTTDHVESGHTSTEANTEADDDQSPTTVTFIKHEVPSSSPSSSETEKEEVTAKPIEDEEQSTVSATQVPVSHPSEDKHPSEAPATTVDATRPTTYRPVYIPLGGSVADGLSDARPSSSPDDLPDPNGLSPLLGEKNEPVPEKKPAVESLPPSTERTSTVPTAVSSSPGLASHVPPLMPAFPPAPSGNVGLEATSSSLDPDVKLFVDLCNDLAFSLYSQVTGASQSIPNIRGTHGSGVQTRSLVVSPFAISSMLAMVFLGARGPTSEQMNDLLHLDDVITFNPHLVLQNVTESVITSPGVSAAAFVRELYSDKTKGNLLEFYKARAKAFYEGHVEEVDFKDVNDVIRRRTNHLVRWQTRGRVPEYLRGSSLRLRPPLAALSANFFEADCQRASSTGTDGEMYFEVPAMGRRRRRLVPIPAVVWRGVFLAGYDPGLDATVLELRHGGGEVSTVLVLPGRHGQSVPDDPTGGLSRLETWLAKGGKASWSSLLRSAVPRGPIEVQLPRFAHRSVLNVTGALTRMGLPDLFTGGKADLRGLDGSIGGTLHLSDAIQMTAFGVCAEDGNSRRHLETYPSAQRTGRSGGDDVEEGGVASEEEEPAADETSDETSTTTTTSAEESAEESTTTSFPREGRAAAWGEGEEGLDDQSYAFAAAEAARELPLALRPRQARIPRPTQGSAALLPRLRFDRPFLYFVRHNPSGFILLMGRFNPRLFP